MRKRILIGGSSLAGKSTLATALGQVLGWEVVSTDYLARHPGRPWRDDGSEVPPNVVEHFLSHSPEDLLAEVLRHYRSLAPRIREVFAGKAEGLVIEGSAVMPELAVELLDRSTRCVFLVAEPGVLAGRILDHAGMENQPAARFSARAELMNAFVAGEAERFGLVVLPATTSTEQAIELILAENGFMESRYC